MLEPEDSPDPEFRQLFRAAVRGDMDAFARLVRQHLEWLETGHRYGDTIMARAVIDGQADVITCLFEHGASLVRARKWDEPFLHLALKCRHPQIAALMLSRGANPIERNIIRETPLVVACSKHNIETMRLLLRYDAVIDHLEAEDIYSRTSLYHASVEPHALEMLLDVGTDPTKVLNTYMIETAFGQYQSPKSAMERARFFRCGPTVRMLQMWERRYMLTQARRIHDDVLSTEAVPIATQVGAAAATYLKGRVAEGLELPYVRVEIVREEWGEKEGCEEASPCWLSAYGEGDERHRYGAQVGRAVVEHVLSGMTKELFVDIMIELVVAAA